jgi:phosphoribosylformylglycinamidine synthase subunit PurQ / glutaminase
MAQDALQLRVSLIQFPGSNCDWDCIDSLKRHFSLDVRPIWHSETNLGKTDAIILPGGFSYGDYLRSGSIAAMSPIMQEVRKFVDKGGPVIGICNGFQILTETRILPGALLKNAGGKFICSNENVSIEDCKSVQTPSLKIGSTLNIPIAHGEGNYFIDAVGLSELKDNGQVLLRYQDNPNGSIDNIAGITSNSGRVWGMMPHPERATDKILGGSEDGLVLWKAFFEACL